MSEGVTDTREEISLLSEVERSIIELFVDGVRVIGLPKSVGEIYGLLFASRDPLSLDGPGTIAVPRPEGHSANRSSSFVVKREFDSWQR